MTETEFFYIKLSCFIVIFFTAIIKYRFWKKAKSLEPQMSPFIFQFIVWYNSYVMYESSNYEIKDFMMINNITNKIIWVFALILITSYTLTLL